MVSTSKSAFLTSQGTLLVVLEPLKQMRADPGDRLSVLFLKSANDVFALI